MHFEMGLYGSIPLTHKRRPIDQRWTGILQNKLGNKYEIIEEGLSARTIDIDDLEHKGKNGLEYIFPCLMSHFPIDIIVLMLGINDLKNKFNKSPEKIVYSIQKTINEIIESAKEKGEKLPKIILVCPTIIDEDIVNKEMVSKFTGGEEKSKKLPELYEKIAIKNKLNYINLQNMVKPSKEDGLHFDIETHQTIANIFAKELLNIS